MRKFKSLMYRTRSVHIFMLALYLIIPLMISLDELAEATKEKQSNDQIFNKLITNHTSHFNSLPLETSKSINRLEPNLTTHLNDKQTNDLDNPNSHEISSSSTQQSFIHGTVREKDPIKDTNYHIGILGDSPDFNYFTSDSKLINRFRQPVLMSEYDVRAHLSGVPFAQAMSGGLGTVDSSGPQVYEAQTNYQMGVPPSHLENSFYLNMMGATPMSMQNERIPDEGASSDFSSNQYANPANQASQAAHQNYILSSGMMSPQDYGKQSYIMSNQHRIDPFDAKDQIARNQKILTNAQIVSLIDELKEFNSRKLKEALKNKAKTQAELNKSRRKQSDDQQSLKINKAVSKFTKNLNSRRSQDNDSDDDVKKTNNNSSDDDQDSDDESERREDDVKNEDDDELKKEDLQKLASFIFEQQKENNRLLNARRRNSGSDSDDEDAEMRDSLLENSHKIQANEEPQGIHKNSKEVPSDNSQLVELLKKLSTKTNVVEDSNSYEDNEKTGDQDDSDKARKRRANEEASASANSLKKSADNNISPIMSLINEDFDRHGIKVASTTPKETSTKENWAGRQSKPKDKLVNKRVGDLDDVNSSSSSQVGEEESEYPRSERMKDLETLRQGLARSREAQLRISRIPLPLSPLFREALSNELTKVTDQTIVQSSSSEDEKSDPNNNVKSSSWRNEPEVGEESTNSDLSPSRVDPEHLTNKVKSKVVNHQIGEEYPISETVNDRINKLSHNLDRYFNDGFLDKFKNKTSSNVKSAANQEAESRVEIQIEPRKNSLKKVGDTNETAQDDDFDVNVAIDGKREAPELEDELNEDGKEKTKNKRIYLNKSTIGSKRLRREKNSSNEKAKKIRGQNKELAGRLIPNKAKRHATNHGGARWQQQREGKKTVKFDPVDSETLDTPIGPDNKQSKAAGTERIKGYKEKLSNFSRNSEKFFQEPD